MVPARDVRRAASVGRVLRLPVAPVAAAGLVVAFALAQGTGVRWLGAVVLLATAAVCLVLAVPRVGWWRPLVVLAVGVVVFAASHPAADLVGTWPAVLTAAAALAATGWWLVDRARPRVPQR